MSHQCLNPIDVFLSQPHTPHWPRFAALIDELSRYASPPPPQNLLLQFLYAEIPLAHFQTWLARLCSPVSRLTEHFACFLSAPLNGVAQRAAARGYLCALTGLPTSMPGVNSEAIETVGKGESSSPHARPTMAEVQEWMQRVEERFSDRPGSVRDVVRISMSLLSVPTGAARGRERLEEVLEGENDLLAFLQRWWPYNGASGRRG